MSVKKKKRSLITKFRKLDVPVEIRFKKGLNIKEIFKYRKKLQWERDCECVGDPQMQ